MLIEDPFRVGKFMPVATSEWSVFLSIFLAIKCMQKEVRMNPTAKANPLAAIDHAGCLRTFGRMNSPHRS